MKKNGARRDRTAHKRTRRSVGGIKGMLIGMLLGLAAWLLLMVLAAAALTGADDPTRYILPAALLLAAVGSFVSGFLSEKLSGGQPILVGAVTSVCLMGVMCLLAGVSPDTAENAVLLRIAMAAVIVSFALLGAHMAAKREKKTPIARRRQTLRP